MTFGILQQLNFCSEKRFTGKLCVTNIGNDKINDFGINHWNIYFYRGRLVGDSAGIHPMRRWRRQFSQQQIDVPENMARIFFVSDKLEDRNHLALNQLLESEQIEREKVEKIIEGSLLEVLFDILYYEENINAKNGEPFTYTLQSDRENSTLIPPVLIKLETIWKKAQNSFQSWQGQNYMNYSPNHTPYIDDYIELQKLVPTSHYTKIIELLNGQRTFRDIAIKINEKIEIVTMNILRFHHLNILSLKSLPDINYHEQKTTATIIQSTASNILSGSLSPNKKKLVAHLGDKQAEIKTIESIVKNAGHEYINLQESTQVFLTFLKYQPDLILIDNSSTKINAMELCNQLRRTAKFKDTPIVFLSGNEGMMNWLRNKTSHSAEYITQPLSHQKIFTVLNKYVNAA